MNRWLGRGINFGNALDALGDGPELPLRGRYFDEVAEAGFDTVRLPVRWSAHAGTAPPYAIDPAFFRRVDAGVAAALGRGLQVVVNVHHYHELCAAPDEHLPRFLALWRQIAARYAGHPAQLCFELLNEPRGALTAARWNAVLAAALAVVRAADPGRTVLVGPAGMNGLDALPALAVPGDGNLIATIHYYAPFEFTHQGAGWVAGAQRWLGRTWGGTTDEDAVRADLARVAAWGTQQRLPVFLGEFGAFSAADPASRARWTAFVRAEAERLGLSWAYWEFGTDFGAFDLERGAWREPLRRALLGDEEPGGRAVTRRTWIGGGVGTRGDFVPDREEQTWNGRTPSPRFRPCSTRSPGRWKLSPRSCGRRTISGSCCSTCAGRCATPSPASTRPRSRW